MVSKTVIVLFSCCLFCGSGVVPCFNSMQPWAAADAGDEAATKEKSEEQKKEQATPDKTYRMEEMVVVAPPVVEGNQTNRLGSQVTTVTEQQIEDLNAQDLQSALRMTPGVVISRHNPIGSFGGGEGGAIFIRGMGISRPGSEIQVLVDGVPKFVSVWTHPLMDLFSVDNIDQIEVYKGAQPVLFGNMAFSAVDITTKRKWEPGFRTNFEGAYGSYNNWIEVAEHGGKIDAFDYYLVQSFRTSDGHREDSDGYLQNYFGRVGYQLSDNWNANALFIRTDNSSNDPGPDDGSFPPDGTFKTNDYFTIGTLSNEFEKARGYIKFYSENGHIDWLDQFNETTGENDEDTITDYDNYGLRIREAFNLWEGGEIMVGTDLDFISGEVDIRSPSADDLHFDRTTWRLFQPYLAVSHLFGSKEGFYAVPSAGVRHIDHSEFDAETGPQGGLIFGYKSTELHVSYARGINYPGIFVKAMDELFQPDDNQWDSLSAELVDHFEVGIGQSLGKLAKFDFTFFYDDGTDRIVVSPPPPYPPTWTNIGSFRNNGVEATVTLTPFRDLALFAGVTYLDSTPEDLPYAPEWSASFGVNYRFLQKFQASLDGVYVGEHFVTSRARTEDTVNVDKVDSYFVLNAKLTYDLKIPYRSLQGQLFAAGDNLTDADYEQKFGYPMPGINGMGGIRIKF